MRLFRFILLAALLLVHINARAQMPGGGQVGMNAVMLQLFGEVKDFSARAEVRMLDARSKEIMSAPMEFALRNGSDLRIELEMSKMKSKELSAEIIGQFKLLGMDRMVTIVRPDQKQAMVIYPILQAYVLMPMAPEEAANFQKVYKVEKSKAGKDSIDGHPCVKNKVIVKGAAGEKHEAVTWNATDLNNFPVKMQMSEKDATVEFVFKAIKMGKPEAKQFEAPADHTKFSSVDKLAQEAMVKRLGGQK